MEDAYGATAVLSYFKGGNALRAHREYVFKALSEIHRKHQAVKPGNTDKDCGVCRINNGTLYTEKSDK